MKKIMFDDRFALTQAVLEGTKTMTRRMVPDIPPVMKIARDGTMEFYPATQLEVRNGYLRSFHEGCKGWYTPVLCQPRYKIGEVVAIAQKYCEVMAYLADSFCQPRPDYMMDKAAWNNKMFVRADLMPHQIRITNIRVERIQDISNEDCLREGIYLDKTAPPCYRPFYTFQGSQECGTPVGYPTAREAYEGLITQLSSKITWDDNPYVFVYTFELVK